MTSQSRRHVLVGWALMALGVVGTAGAGSPSEHAPTGLLVFAAASLSDALEEVDRAFTARTGVRVSAVTDGSRPPIRTQCRQGSMRARR